MKPVAVVLGLALASTASDARAPSLSHAVQMGFEHGFKTCASAMDGYVRYLHEDDEAYSHVGLWSDENADGSLFATMTVEPAPEGDMIATVSAVRNVNRKCDVTFTQVVPVIDKACAELRDTVFKGWKYYDTFSKSTVLDDPSTSGASAILSPLPNGGCMVVKHVVALGLG